MEKGKFVAIVMVLAVFISGMQGTVQVKAGEEDAHRTGMVLSAVDKSY